MRHYLLACVVATSGCAHFLKLDPKNVTALEVSGDAAAQVCARGALIDVRAVTKDGQKHAEGDSGHPKENEFDPSLVKLEASVGSFHERSWNPPDDPLALLSVDELTITASLVANPAITATTKVSPTWACDPPSAYVGGNDGGQGDMSTDEGGEGGTGGNGDNGQNVVVTVGWIQHGNGRLAIADVQADSGESVYVLDPSTPLKVFAGGGAGGAGGTGGWGRGLNSCEGKGGPGGRGGGGGDGGDGGNVTVRYDASSPELAQLVVVDVQGGAAGPGGTGGGGGAGPNGCGEWGASGADGREGRAGRDGRVSMQATGGVNAQLASLSHGGPAPARMPPRPRGPSVEPAVANVPRAPRDTADGARYYAGRAEITATVPHHKPEHQRTTLQVESTRTRRRHFTIAFGACKLEFHRPPGEKRHVYALDAPTKCQDGQGFVDIHDATLELDTAHDRLAMRFNGTGQAPGIGAMTVAFTFTGDRR